MTEVPKTLNFYPVIRSRPMVFGGHRVMVYRENHPVHPFVVARWWPDLGSCWQSGHYFFTEKEALEEYKWGC